MKIGSRKIEVLLYRAYTVLKNQDLPFDYFEELARRIQDIRTSERRFYQKITDIYATSVDYVPTLTGNISKS